MEAPPAGAVVLISFPFSDLSRSKLRPAVVLASVSRGDYVLCQVTSNPYADPKAVELTEESFGEGSLQRVSYARPGKLFTANTDLFEGQVGVLNEEMRGEIVSEIVKFLRAGEMPSEGK
jgi:mRNA interferase MazF